MFQSHAINRKMKKEQNRIPTRTPKELIRKTLKKNFSFEFHKEFDQFPKKLRCSSTYSNECGFRPRKYQLFHDIISEFAEHKKQRLANVIIHNLKKTNQHSSGSSRNLFSKSGVNSNHNYSQFMKKVKDLKISDPNIVIDRQTGIQSVHEVTSQTRQPSLEIEQIIETKQTITLSTSRKQSPNYQISIKLQQVEPQFILKSQFKRNNALEKILTEARNQIKTSQSPRSVMTSQHKKTKSHPINVYTEQNKLLLRTIFKTKMNFNQ